MYGMVETYFGAFFEYLKYSSYEISILSTFPIFFGALFQNITGWLYDVFRSRKTLLVVLKITQTLTIPLLLYVGYISGNYYLLLGIVCIYYALAISQMFPGPHGWDILFLADLEEDILEIDLRSCEYSC